MSSYYAIPVRRENRTLFYNPLDGNGVVAATPHDAAIQLGVPEAGQMFAVWPLTRKAGLEEAGRVCSFMAPNRIFIMVDPEQCVFFPLGLDPLLDSVVEVPGADSDG